MEKILVIAEHKEGQLRNVSFESIAAAKKLNETAEIVGVILSDEFAEDEAQKFIHYGADRVIFAVNEKLGLYTSDGYTQAIDVIIKEESPDGIVMGHTSIGKDLTPRIAAKLDTGLVSDIIDIEKNEDQIEFIRPIYSGKAFERKIITEGISFITIRPNNIATLEYDESRSGEISRKDVDIADIRTIIKDVVRKASKGVDLSEAKIVVSGGRGLKSAEGFDLLYELADVLGAAVGASRGACDAGYCDYALQIGQTGKVVTPDLYIAVGISGAIQHLAGMSNSKVIVAINSDPEANIFSIADYGMVGDLFEIIPLLIEEVKALKVHA